MLVSIYAGISLSVSTDLLSSVIVFNLLGSPVALYYLQKQLSVKGG
jgi:hypothetical protein